MRNKNNDETFLIIKEDIQLNLNNPNKKRQKNFINLSEVVQSGNSYFVNCDKIKYKSKSPNLSSDFIHLKNDKQTPFTQDSSWVDRFQNKLIDIKLRKRNKISPLKEKRGKIVAKDVSFQSSSQINSSVVELFHSSNYCNKLKIKDSGSWFENQEQVPIHYTHHNFFKKKQKNKILFRHFKQKQQKKELLNTQFKTLKQSSIRLSRDKRPNYDKFKDIPKKANIEQISQQKVRQKQQFSYKKMNNKGLIILIHQNQLINRNFKKNTRPNRARFLSLQINTKQLHKNHNCLLIQNKIRNKTENIDISPWEQNMNQSRQNFISNY